MTVDSIAVHDTRILTHTGVPGTVQYSTVQYSTVQYSTESKSYTTVYRGIKGSPCLRHCHLHSLSRPSSLCNMTYTGTTCRPTRVGSVRRLCVKPTTSFHMSLTWHLACHSSMTESRIPITSRHPPPATEDCRLAQIFAILDVSAATVE